MIIAERVRSFIYCLWFAATAGNFSAYCLLLLLYPVLYRPFRNTFCIFKMIIPVVDFGAYSLSKEDVTDDQMRNLSKELKTAFTEVGFVFLKNTGITQEEVSKANKVTFLYDVWFVAVVEKIFRKAVVPHCENTPLG